MPLETLSCFVLKEDLNSITFSETDVLKDRKKRNLRSYYLDRATKLGNTLKNKVDIYFKDDQNKLMRINTTVWAHTNNFVVLKKGTVLPLKSIVYIG